MEERKPKAREDFKEFAAKFCEQKFDRIGQMDLALALTRYYVERIHNRTAPIIDPDELDFALVDGANDLGADLIYRDDGRVYVYQSKYKKSVTREEVEAFQSILERLRSKGFKKSKQLLDQLGDIDWETDTFVLKFICLGKIENSALQQTTLPLALPPEPKDLAERVTIEYLDEPRLDEELRTARSSTAGIPGEITLLAHGTRNNRSPIIELPFTDYPSVVLVVSAKQIVGMYRQAKNTLFTLNIRNYIGSTATNSNIIKTALERPKSLYYFNNGISCLARSLKVCQEASSVTTTGIQVINGAQTVRALHRAAAQGTLSDEAFVLVRITEVSQGYGGENKFGSEITKYNNTQNVIKISDFRSNDPIQYDLAARFKEFKRPGGKRIEYAPKRSDERRAQTVVIRLEDYAKVCYSYLCDPVKFSGSTSFLFEASEGGGYCQVFGDGKKVWQIMPEEEFRLRSAVWWMASVFADRLKVEKKQSKDNIFIAALERKWFLICAARLVLEKAFGEEEAKLRMARHWEGDWALGEGRVGMLFEKLYESAKGAVLFAYSDALKRSPTFSHRNWMRNEKSVDSIRDFVSAIPYYREMLETF